MLGCHARCDKYIEYKREREEIIEARRIGSDVEAHVAEVIRNQNKRRRRK